MITAQELRIGNLVKLNNPKARPKEVGNFAEILAIDKEHSFKEYVGTVTVKPLGELDYYGQFLSFIDPIPITPEILYTCGFEDYTLFTNDLWIECNPSVTIFGMNNIEEGVVLPYHIQHLHQLQNLYFSLTGEELTFKP